MMWLLKTYVSARTSSSLAEMHPYILFSSLIDRCWNWFTNVYRMKATISCIPWRYSAVNTRLYFLESSNLTIRRKISMTDALNESGESAGYTRLKCSWLIMSGSSRRTSLIMMSFSSRRNGPICWKSSKRHLNSIRFFCSSMRICSYVNAFGVMHFESRSQRSEIAFWLMLERFCFRIWCCRDSGLYIAEMGKKTVHL